jgi:hypothetical protein
MRMTRAGRKKTVRLGGLYSYLPARSHQLGCVPLPKTTDAAKRSLAVPALLCSDNHLLSLLLKAQGRSGSLLSPAWDMEPSLVGFSYTE